MNIETKIIEDRRKLTLLRCSTNVKEGQTVNFLLATGTLEGGQGQGTAIIVREVWLHY